MIEPPAGRRSRGPQSGARAAALALGLAVAGCGPQSPAPGNPGAEVRNPPIEKPPAAEGTRIRTGVDLQEAAWTNASFWFFQTELSPATLCYAKTPTLSCFTELAATGLGAPAFVVFNREWGPRPVKNGMAIDPSSMLECWVMVWFAGAAGWTNGDCPWVLFLQHKPVAIQLDERGLHFAFPREAGHVVFLPLYGCAWLPPKAAGVPPRRGSDQKSIRTWEWENRIPREVFARVRYWASALRQFPMQGEESFTVDRARDELIIRSAVQWLRIADDWHTAPLKLAPVSPPLARAWTDKAPVTFSHKVFDMDLPLPGGPCVGVQGVDSFRATLRLSDYVSEARTRTGTAQGQPAGRSGLEGLVRRLVSAGTNPVAAQAAREDFCRPGGWPDDDPPRNRAPNWPELTCPGWQAPGGAPWCFGKIKPVAAGEPKRVRAIPTLGGAWLTVYELP